MSPPVFRCGGSHGRSSGGYALQPPPRVRASGLQARHRQQSAANGCPRMRVVSVCGCRGQPHHPSDTAPPPPAIHSVHTVPSDSVVSGGRAISLWTVITGSGLLPRPASPAVLPGLPPYALRAGRSGCGSTSSAALQMESQEPSLRGRAYARSLSRSAQQAVACRASRAPGPDGPLASLPARAVAAASAAAFFLIGCQYF